MHRLRIRILQVYGVFSVSCVVEMEISFDNPGFQLDVTDQVDVHQADVPCPSSGSSSSGEATRRSCARCHGRMISFSLDRHLFCTKCRGSDCDIGADAETSRDPPPEDDGKSQHPRVQSGPRVGFSYPTETEYVFHPKEDEDDDKDSIADPSVLDKTYARLINFIYDRFSHSHPSVNAHVPPRCEFEDFLAISDPPSASRQNLTVYPRVAEIVKH